MRLIPKRRQKQDRCFRHNNGINDRHCRTAPRYRVRFFTVPKVSDARKSAGYALLFIALLYTTAPAVGAFARLNFVDTVHNTQYTEVAGWFKSWEDIGLIGWQDKNNDGRIQYHPGAPFDGKPTFDDERRPDGSRNVTNTSTDSRNEVYGPRHYGAGESGDCAIASLGNCLGRGRQPAAALSTAAGLLLVISTSISHDLLKQTMAKGLTDRKSYFMPGSRQQQQY